MFRDDELRILIVNTLYYPYRVGGAEVSVQLLAEELASVGHQVRVLSLHERPSRKVEVINKVEVVRLPLKNIYWPFGPSRASKLKRLVWHVIDTFNPAMARAVAEELDDFCPDVVHSNNISGFSVAYWQEVKKRNIRLVHTARDYYLFHPNSTLYASGKNMSAGLVSVRLWSYWRRRACFLVDQFVGISEFVVDFHKNNGFFEKISAAVIYNPILHSSVSRAVSDSRVKTVGYIGRFSEEKGFDDFCRIAKSFASQSLHFVAAGKYKNASSSEQLKVMAEEAKIDILGYVPIHQFVQRVDAVILPIKWREPFGRVVVECALAGCKVYTSKVGGISELFPYLPNLFEIGTFAYTVNSRPKEISGEERLFSKEKIAAQYQAVYEGMAEVARVD